MEQQALLHSISAYVPGFIIRQIVANPSAFFPGWVEHRQAALLFADVSGFTAISENLSRLGKEGAEELTRILNTYFAAMIDRVYQYSGQIIKFGGDAITCAFMAPAADGDSSLELNVQQAVHCALAMQQEMARFQAVETKGETFQLRMKIGIGMGPVLFLSVGTAEEGMEHVPAGRPLDRMAQAEQQAAAGEVWLDGEGLADAGMRWEELGIVAAEERGSLLRVQGMTRPLETGKALDVDWTALGAEVVQRVVERLVPYLPPTVYERLAEGQRQFVGEHRRVASLFVNFFGIDYDDDPQAATKLQRYFGEMQAVVHRYGGRLNRVNTGDKGSMLHLIFGAPVAHEDNEVRAVGCAMEMQRLVVESRDLSFITDQRVGIASGYVFAGNVGAERRREYTVMGDVVNLSARLMQAASPGGILLDQYTARRVEGQFACESLPPIHVKGKRDPIPVCRPVRLRQKYRAWSSPKTSRHASPLVGREDELAQIDHIIGLAREGRGQLLVISGEAGVGKTRLLEEIVNRAQRQGAHSLGGNCLSYGAQSPYLPWIGFFNALFDLGVGEREGTAAKIARIEREMAAVGPGLGDWAPLVAQILGLPAPDNQLTASLDAQLRKQRVFDITLALLRHRARCAPLFLLLFEDVHWIDSISLEMLNYVARNIGNDRVLLVALHRPTIELAEWPRYDYCHHLALTDLPAEDAIKLVQFKLGMAEVPQPLQERVLRGEARVNPFFVEELVNSLVDRGYLLPRAGGEGYELVGDLAQVAIPDSVQALVMSRIDRLDESSKLTIKVAAVIGRTFRYRTLQGIYPITIQPEKLQENLVRLNALDLTPLDRPAPEWEYIFRHIITQEVAYESLLYAHRRDLHHRLGEYLERTYGENLAEYYELLAHHYGQSGDREKGWDYLVKAGDKARGQYANESAIAYYNQALALEVHRAEAYRVYESLGAVYRLIGQYDQALASYQQALSHQPPTPFHVADIQRQIAKTWELQGWYDEAWQHLQLAHATLGSAQDTAEMARIYNDMGWIANQRGEYQEGLQLCVQGLEIAEALPRADEPGRQVKDQLQHTMGTIYWRMGDFDQAIARFQKCIEMREQAGDLYNLVRSYNNLAAVYWSRSNFDAAAQYVEQSLAVSRKIGDTYAMAMGYNNLGVILYTLGRYHQAIERYEKSLDIRQAIGDMQGIADVYNNLGEVHHGLGNHRQALQYLGQVVRIVTEIGNKDALLDAHKLLAETNLELGDLAAARDHGQSLLAIARELGNQRFEGIAYRVLGRIERIAGRLAASREQLLQSVAVMAKTGEKLELGRSSCELGLTLLALDDPQGRQHLQQAIQIFAELGVAAELEKARAALGVPPE
ncbi:MAG: tetratricopeptide repeat protein [Anaerolineae bacterium]|nr:tetratricopeptide repeat protein [Anaerolineae bacterium]